MVRCPFWRVIGTFIFLHSLVVNLHVPRGAATLRNAFLSRDAELNFPLVSFVSRKYLFVLRSRKRTIIQIYTS